MGDTTGNMMSDPTATPSTALRKIVLPERLLSWVNIRDIALLALIVILIYKIARADLKFDFSAFSFTDLLALILALFSVWLSVAFYFKADDGSKQFYDNSYRFTKETSELLGRIEAGFGERLRHLDEGYNQMLGRIDRLPTSAIGAKVDQQETVIEQAEEERRNLFEKLAERAMLAEGEKATLFANLERTNAQLEMAHQKVAELERHRRVPASQKAGTSGIAAISNAANAIWRSCPDLEINDLWENNVQSLWIEVLPSLSAERVAFAQENGLVGDDGHLTSHGVDTLAQFLSRRIRDSRKPSRD